MTRISLLILFPFKTPPLHPIFFLLLCKQLMSYEQQIIKIAYNCNKSTDDGQPYI